MARERGTNYTQTDSQNIKTKEYHSLDTYVIKAAFWKHFNKGKWRREDLEADQDRCCSAI